MSRDQTRNIETFKIGGNRVNKFEFNKHQAEMAEQFAQRSGEEGTDAKPLTQAERVAQLIAKAHQKVEKKKRREAAKAGVPKNTKAQKNRASKSSSGRAGNKGAKAKPTRRKAVKK
jgi:hypothetical protein